MTTYTDDELMAETAEAILMGSAFEQLLSADSSYKLGKKFGALFGRFGSATVKDALAARPGIDIDTTTTERAAAQPHWWVHRKWMEELYDLRSKSVHKGHHSDRTWGWSLFEHLAMAAWVFPLTVKMLLQREGHYQLTDHDCSHCLAIDQLLAVDGWGELIEDGIGPPRWHEVVSTTRRNYELSAIAKRFAQQHSTEAPPSSDS